MVGIPENQCDLVYREQYSMCIGESVQTRRVLYEKKTAMGKRNGGRD